MISGRQGGRTGGRTPKGRCDNDWRQSCDPWQTVLLGTYPHALSKLDSNFNPDAIVRARILSLIDYLSRIQENDGFVSPMPEHLVQLTPSLPSRAGRSMPHLVAT